MSGEPEAGRTEEFAVLLRALKDRSGLSYGALAKRLHMSASTLHRYCHGTAVPVEYAPVERLARVCRATPQELVELHRRWVLADANRLLRADRPDRAERNDPGAVTSGGAAAAAPVAGDVSGTDGSRQNASEAGGTGGSLQGPAQAAAGDASDTDGSRQTAAEPAVEGAGRSSGLTGGAHDAGDEAVVLGVRPPASPRRRTVLVAGGVVVVAALVGGLLVGRPWGDGGGSASAVGPTTVESSAEQPTAAPSRTPSASASSPSASASATPSRTGGTGSSHKAAAPKDGPVPLAVNTRPYVYDNPCAQHFLVRSEPGQVGPPASEDEAPRWAAVYGAVSSGDQRVALTVQGTGAQTVVLEGLHVQVESKGAPLAWNDYSMGVGCGGDAQSASFDVDLDAGSPVLTAKNGQRGFPFKVSESDPEVISVTAHTTAHDVRWYLTLQWSSGTRHGTVRVDNSGTQFRTSADVDRPGYDYPLGWTDWIPRTG